MFNAVPRLGAWSSARRPSRFRILDVLVLLAAGLLLVQAPASVAAASWVPNLEPLPKLAVAGLLVGYLIERTQLAGALGLPLGFLLGGEAVTYVFAQAGVEGNLAERVEWLDGRIGAWLNTIANGGVSNDPLVFAVAMAVLAWVLGVLTAWLVFRDDVPWLVVLLNGVALLMNLSYASTSLVGYVGWFGFAACLLLAAKQLANRTELWRRADLKVSWRVAANVLFGTAIASGGLLSLAWALPTNVSSSEVASGWNRVTAPWQGLEGEFDRWFAALNSSEHTARGLSFGRTLAPRGAFDLADTPVLEVHASGPLYLRATTADRYTGQAITSSEASATQFDANADLVSPDGLPQARGLLQAQIKVLASRTSVAFAPDTPVRFSQSVQVDTRAEANDIATIRLEAPVLQNQDYTVISAVSTATLQQLRAAGEDYPDSIRRRYLQLPRSVSRRSIDLAHEVAAGATSAYDKAAALETYLRNNFTYSTHVASVPSDQDWVDSFLFGSKEGYCDYFATTMVVLLRAQGVPARVASGFAPGEFDASTGISIVRENHAHTWVETYFPGYGWVTFEPSAIRPLPSRLEEAPVPVPAAGTAPAPMPDASTLTRAELDELLNIRDQAGPAPTAPFLSSWLGILALAVGAIILVALIAAGCVALAWRRGLASLAGYQQPYAQLVRLGGWSGALRARPSDTPWEVAERLGRQVPRTRAAIDELTSAYVEGTYANRTPVVDPWPGWLVVRREVVRGLLGRRLGAWFGEDTSVAPPPHSHPELLSQWGASQRATSEAGRANPITPQRWWRKVVPRRRVGAGREESD
ncbi:MAG: transglutaminase TgpA family protein [Chloroflexota bacterium]